MFVDLGLADGGDGADRLVGQAEADRLFGDTGQDRLLGKWGNDTLNGGGGEDVLAGGRGDDVLFGDQPGSSAADTFLYLSDGASRLGGNDTIADFEAGHDRMVLAAASNGNDLGFDDLDTNRDRILDGRDDHISVVGNLSGDPTPGSLTIDIAGGLGFDNLEETITILGIQSLSPAELQG